MAEKSNRKIQQLESEIERLTAEIETFHKKSWFMKHASQLGFGLGSWLSGKWLGAELLKSSQLLGEGVDAWKKGKREAPFQEGFDFGVAIITRFTRLGIFRIIIVVIAAIGTSIFAISQLFLLHNQNDSIERQRISEATERFVYFLEQEEISRRLLGLTFDKYYPLKTLDLSISSSVDKNILRGKIAVATPTQDTVSQITQKCGISLYPVQNPREIAKLAVQKIENNNLLGARLETANLRRWLKSAADNCNKRVRLMNGIRTKMQSEAGLMAAPEITKNKTQ